MASAEVGRAAFELGHRAEVRVAEELAQAGWELLARNHAAAGGELDLVVAREGRLRFVEVKARTHPASDPEEAVTRVKRSRLVAAARAWLDARSAAWEEMAFLVVVVDCTTDPWSTTWYDDAFDAADGGRGGWGG